MIYYHVTPHTRLRQIRAKGLLTGRRRMWRNMFGVQLGSTTKIYLFSNLDAAIHFAGRLEWGLKELNRKSADVDILKIEADIPVEPDDHIEARMRPGTWWTTTSPIPPEAIREVIPLTLQMKRDFIARRDATGY